MFSLLMFSQILPSINDFLKIPFCGSFGISLSTGRNVGTGKAAYNWIYSDPAKAGPTLGVIVVAVVVVVVESYANNFDNTHGLGS